MKAAVVDTNVLIVANADDRASQASPACVRAGVAALRDIQAGGRLVLDAGWLIIGEYRKQVSPSGQPGVGDAFLKWALTNRMNPIACELVRVTPRGTAPDDFEEFPSDARLERFDRADRKFVAAARASAHEPPVLNATDTDWWTHRAALEHYGVHVAFLCPELMAARGR